MKHLLIIIFISLSIVGFSQTKQFEFAEGMCEYVGDYNYEKYSQIEIQNTFDYLYFSPYINAPSTAWKLEDISKLSIDSLKSECKYRLDQLDSLDFINSDFWELARQNRIKEISETCNLKALTIIAYENPDTLMSFVQTDSLTTLFRNALIWGGDQLIEAWEKLNEIQKSMNGFPENVQSKFEAQYNSSLKMEYARLAVIQFGWWNHANHLIYHDPQTDYWNEFEKLFINLESECY